MSRTPFLAGAILLAACLDNSGPDDFPAQRIRAIAAPEGVQFPTDTLDSAIAVQVTDAEGNPSPGRAVTWAASHGGLLIPISGVTDADGVARAVWVLGVAPGRQVATARAGADLSLTIEAETEGWRVASVSSGTGDHACAIDLAGAAWCWGGLGRPDPERIETAERFTSIVAGASHLCALTEGRRVLCWGSNSEGQLGDGTTRDRSTPVPPMLPDLEFSSVVAGYASTCALTTTGVAYCWGLNRLGILGRGFESGFETIPAPVAGGPAWRAIAISGFAACAIDAQRQVNCWGEREHAAPAVLSPLVVEGVHGDALAMSDYAKCARDAATLYCWESHSGIDAPQSLGLGVLSLTAASKEFYGLGTDGFGYYWGALPNSSYFWGDPPMRFEGDMRFSAVGGSKPTPLAIELETSTLYRWSGFAPDPARPLGPTPMRPPSE